LAPNRVKSGTSLFSGRGTNGCGRLGNISRMKGESCATRGIRARKRVKRNIRIEDGKVKIPGGGI